MIRLMMILLLAAGVGYLALRFVRWLGAMPPEAKRSFFGWLYSMLRWLPLGKFGLLLALVRNIFRR